jgi:5-methylcytosine-specific restriction protein A
VDHVQPIKEGGARFDAANLQSLCVSCHNAKTARESARRRPTPR